MNENIVQSVPVKLKRLTIDSVPVVPKLPASLVVRQAQADESKQLAAVLARAYPNEAWEPAETEQEIFFDETVKAPLIVTQGSRILATASLQIRTDSPECGWVRWVATEPDRRRQGLAQTLIVSLLEIAADSECVQIHLRTTTDLSGAIAMYLKLGFEPLIANRQEQDLWDKMLLQLGKKCR